MDRDRLTITLKLDVLKKLDQSIDGVHIRNRSHAIESILIQALSNKINQAVILAGGQGVKLRPLTYEIPKALIPVAGQPILEYLIKLLRDADVYQIILATGHLGEKIKDHFGNGSKFGVQIAYSPETKPLGTGGALLNTRKLLKKSPFLVVHGDILADMNLSELIAFHNQEQVVGTIALTTSPELSDYGMVALRGSKIVHFVEKPKKKDRISQLINSGIYVFEQQIFDYLGDSPYALLEDTFPRLAKEKKLAGFAFEGKWFDVTTAKNYEQAIKSWRPSRKIL